MTLRPSPVIAPVQELRRDAGHTAGILPTWLRGRLPGSELRITGITTPDGTGEAKETLLLDARWRDSAGALVEGGFVGRVGVEDPLYLDDQMHDRGLRPPDVDIAANSDVVQQLVLLLDVPAAGPVTATLPPLSGL